MLLSLAVRQMTVFHPGPEALFLASSSLLWQVVCYAVVITLAAVANLAGTALTIAIQRDWIVSLTGDSRGQLAGEQCHPHQPSDGQRSRVVSHSGLQERPYHSL